MVSVLFKQSIFLLAILTLLLASHFNSFIHQMSAGIALFSGMLLTLILSNPFETLSRQLASSLLTFSIIGLGFGMNLITVAKVGLHGIGYTVMGIIICAFFGLAFGKYLKNKRDTSLLITFGTAICGGSAIAAIAPVIRARHQEISVALATIFILNAIALFIFPIIGHHLQLNESQFGLWSALAIHDTSSVVGASMQYGNHALNVATTVKLARALWIVPLTILISIYYSRYVFEHTATKEVKPKKPYFILGFLLAASLVTFIPPLKETATYLRQIAEQSLMVALFCIGANLSPHTIKNVGIGPFIQAVLLWLLMAGLSLVTIYFHYISL